MINPDISRKTNLEDGQHCQIAVLDCVVCLAVTIKGGIRIQLESWLREHYNCDCNCKNMQHPAADSSQSAPFEWFYFHQRQPDMGS